MRHIPNATPQRGETLIEALITLGIGLVIFLAVFAAHAAFKSSTDALAVKVSFSRQSEEVSRFLLEDAANAGIGVAPPGASGAVPVVRFEGDKAAKPAAWIADEGRTLCCLRTSAAGAGRVEAVGKSSPPKIIVSGVDPREWKGITNGRLVFLVNQTGPPTLCRLVTSPQTASVSDLDDRTLADRVNLDSALVAVVEPVTSCALITTLNTTVAPGASFVPLQAVVRYTFAPGSGLVRDEFDTCAGIVTDEGRAELVFASDADCSFAVSARDVRVALRLADRKSRRFQDLSLTTEVKQWNK